MQIIYELFEKIEDNSSKQKTYKFEPNSILIVPNRNL